jgi:hypothetical protein
MKLYHGSTVIVDRPQILQTETGRDFGPGFYTTGIKNQALYRFRGGLLKWPTVS